MGEPRGRSAGAREPSADIWGGRPEGSRCGAGSAQDCSDPSRFFPRHQAWPSGRLLMVSAQVAVHEAVRVRR